MRRRRNKSLLVRSLTLLALPVLLTASGYALFSQKLTLHGSTIKPAYTYTQGLLMTYTKNTTPQAGKYLYSQVVTIKNNGTAGVISWQMSFAVPSGTTNLTCSASVTCVLSGTTVTVQSTATSGSLSPAASAQFNLSFLATQDRYTLQNVVVGGTAELTYQTITGLNVTAVAGKRVKNGRGFAWPYTITVTNNSGQPVSAWRITTNWDPVNAVNTVVSMPTTVNYTTTNTQLTITSKTALANGASFQFTPSLGASGGNWTLSGVVVQGSF